MWADALFLAERNHVLRLLAWGAASVLLGTLLYLAVLVRARGSLLLRHFAVATATLGAVTLALSATWWQRLGYRDLDGFTRLDRALWLGVGLELAVVATGATIACCAWIFGGRHAPLGAGIAAAVQGMGLLVLTLHLLGVVQRLTL